MDTQGRFTVPARIYLSAAERARLDYLLRTEALDLNELLSELLASYLSDKPVPESSAAPEQSSLDELRRRRDEARRMQQLRPVDGNAPSWFSSYLRDLEGEVARLERQVNGD